MSKVLADVNELGALPAADTIVSQFDTRCVAPSTLTTYTKVDYICVKSIRCTVAGGCKGLTTLWPQWMLSSTHFCC